MTTEKESVRSVERAFDILTAFTSERPILTLSEISQIVGLANTTVFRLLQTMEKKGFIFKSPNGTYHLGLALLGPHKVLLKTLNLRTQAEPYMWSLRNEAQETVNLFIIRNKRRVCIESIEGPYRLKDHATIGDVLPLHLGASGKIILANQSESFIREYFREIALDPQMKQIGDQATLIATLDQIRQQGYAYSFGEREVGLCSISAPIRSHEGAVIGAITISGPEARINGDRIQTLADLAINAAADTSRAMGYMSDERGEEAHSC